MGRIVVLDDQMVNMIAAGEVIERPASVLKELLENSLDAGARTIRVEVEDGGRRLIAVTDDGCGMDAEDLRAAFVPHATSKVRRVEDLHAIRTMGFRGEALASIAAVAQVTATSRPADSIEAYRLRIDCGQFEPVAPCPAAPGTTIEVRHLFAKLPGRRKFLRTANTEMGHVVEQFTRVALAHPELAMTLTHNGRPVHRLTGGADRSSRVRELLGRAVGEGLFEARRQEKDVTIHALLGPPATARATGQFQYVFVNGRYIRDRFISHAIREAYRGLVEPNKYPVVFLFLEMAPEAFDVNVHPAKTEVRFVNANLVHSQVLAVLRQTLLSRNLDAGGTLPKAAVPPPRPTDATLGDEEARRQRIARAMADFFQRHPGAGGSQAGGHGGPPAGMPRDSQGIRPSTMGPGGPPASGRPPASGGSHGATGAVAAGASAFGAGSPDTTDAGATVPESSGMLLPAEESVAGGTKITEGGKLPRLMQIHDSYIVVQTAEGFDIIDQHALHERILYERMCRKLAEGPLASQRLLVPEPLDVTESQVEAIASHRDLFARLGIEVVPFGPGTAAVQAFPAMLAGVDPAGFVRDILDRLADRELGLDAERLLHEVLDMAACKAAIKAGQRLGTEEIRQLLADKAVVERASRCPHGRPTTLRFTLAELEKQFKRTGF